MGFHVHRGGYRRGYYGGGWGGGGWGWNTSYRRGYYGYQPIYNPMAGFCVICIIILIIITAIGQGGSSADCTTTDLQSSLNGVSCPNNKHQCWTSLFWSDLSTCERTHWTCFDYTESIWDNNETPSKAVLSWEALAQTTCTGDLNSLQWHATRLGYDSADWYESNQDPWESGAYGWIILGIFAVGVVVCGVVICIKIAQTTANKQQAQQPAVLAQPMPNLPIQTMQAGGLGAAPMAYPVAQPGIAQPVMNNNVAFAQPAMVTATMVGQQPFGAAPVAVPIAQPGMMMAQPGMMMAQPGMANYQKY